MYRQCEHGFVGWHGPYGLWGHLYHARRCSKQGCSDIWFGDEGEDYEGPHVCHGHENGLHYTRIVQCVLCDRYSEWRRAHRLYDKARLEHTCEACASDGPFSLLASPRCVCCGAASAIVDAHPWHVSQSRREELDKFDRAAELRNGVCTACLYRNFLCPLSLTWWKRTDDEWRPDLDYGRGPRIRFLGEQGATIRANWPSGSEWKKKKVADTLAAFWLTGNFEEMRAMSAALLLAASALQKSRNARKAA